MGTIFLVILSISGWEGGGESRVLRQKTKFLTVAYAVLHVLMILS